MKTSQWIKDVKIVIGCEVPELFHVLAKIADREEDSGRGLFARKCQSKILECLETVKIFLGEIRRNAQDFTLHDIQHCINVIDFMGQMLVDVESLNPAEISFFIYAALLHDIGMVKLLDEDISLDDLREDHGERSARFIRERVLISNDGNPFSFGEHDFIYMKYLPPICASHMQEFSFVEKLPQSYEINGMEVDMSLCAILLRLADAMDLKHNRAPYQLYKFIVNRSISEEHWKKHMSISSCQINEKGHFRIDGDCSDELTHRCLYNHLDMIESEIEKVFRWKSGTYPRLRLSSHIIERNINPDGYKMWHHSFSMDILKITKLFMGEQLYGDKKLGLREIVQNSIDACIVRDEMNKKLGAKQDYIYKPEIYIIFDRENNQVIIRDNGTGMNDHIIQNYFLNIGSSYYSSNDFKKKNLKYSPSGYFGIGFLSCFMFSDDVYVRTSHWQEDVEYEFHFIKSDRFVTKTEKSKSFSGTEIKMNLSQFKSAFEYRRMFFEDISVEKNIVEFLYNTFWNLNIKQINNDVIMCSLRTDSFLDVVKDRIIDRFDYRIDLSKYLIDIEGFIYLNSNDIYKKMKCLSDISAKNPLDAMKNGEINISYKIGECFPFIKNFYAYDVKLNIINEVRKEDYNYFLKYIFFPTEDSKIDDNGRQEKEFELSDNELKKYFSSYSWNCLCLMEIVDDHDFKVSFKMKYNIDNITRQKGELYSKLCDYLGYYPSCFIDVIGVDDKMLNKIVYNTDFRMIEHSKFEGKYWLKQASIDFPRLVDLPLNFAFFSIEKIVMRISNSLIVPDTSRKYVINSSAYKLIGAISICIYLWIYDHIKTDKDAFISTQYLRQMILDDWEFYKDLLIPENKPSRIF